HIPGLTPPTATGVLEVADPLLLLGIDADDRQSQGLVQPAHSGQVAELAVPRGIVGPRQTLAVGPQGVVPLPQQAGDGVFRQVDSPPPQSLAQIAERAVSPLQPSNRVPSGGV